MITFNRQSPAAEPAWQAAFSSMLPTIHRYARRAFRHLPVTEQEEAVQEAIANACVAYARLVQQGRCERAFPTVLARFAIAQVRDGRKVGTSINTRDIMSKRAQQRHGFTVERLDRFDHRGEQWIEAIVPDSRTPIADQVWFRIDFPEWLRRLSRRDRRVALELAEGNSTSDVARQFRLSPGRVSQLRRQLHDTWQTFHGEAVPA
jgi:RNA polymerase sigma factor (sigma-70 family)